MASVQELAYAHHQRREHYLSVETIRLRRVPDEGTVLPHTPIRKIRRSIHEDARNVARAVAKTRLYKQSRKDRNKVEMLFAHLKRILNLRRLRLRGSSGAHDEFLLDRKSRHVGKECR